MEILSDADAKRRPAAPHRGAMAGGCGGSRHNQSEREDREHISIGAGRLDPSSATFAYPPTLYLSQLCTDPRLDKFRPSRRIVIITSQ